MKVSTIHMFVPSCTHRHQPARSTGGSVARMMTRSSNAPAQAATRREQPIMCAKPKYELEPHNIDNPDQIYTKVDNF